MLQLVRFALHKPYTFVVLAIMIVVSGTLAWVRTPTDIFPDIRIPVVAVIWNYNGLPPKDMAGRIVGYYERQLPATVADIEHIESQSLGGVGVVKVYFQPGVDIRTAMSQVTAVSQTLLKQMPPGITPPQILNYSASSVPIFQVALSSNSLSEQKLFDLGTQVIRPALSSVAGAALPLPYGGRQRQIIVDLDPDALRARHLSAVDVGAALAAQNQIVPSGTAKVGDREYDVLLNNAPDAIQRLGDLPIRTVDGATVYMRDIASVHDGSPPQTNVVRVDGHRSVLLSVVKNGATSTLAIVDGVRKRLADLKPVLPAAMTIAPLSDQSVFVKDAVSGVIREGAMAAALTSLMILLFLGSWRSTVIIAASIPLAILAAVAALAVTGQTLNVMTLGGLALAVGILVDDATVTIENINWHLENGKSVRDAILDGAAQIVQPAFVSLLCICIAFAPMFFIPGVAGFLFAPMAQAVVFAMIASFLLSRTLVPTMANFLLRAHPGAHGVAVAESHDALAGRRTSRNPFARFQHGFERKFEHLHSAYAGLLKLALGTPRRFLPIFLAVVLASFALVPMLGRDFFPAIDAGQIAIHVRAPIGTRLESNAVRFDRIERQIRQIVPADQIVSIVDNIGLPVSGINLAYSNSGTIGPQDGDILVTLSHDHGPTAGFVRTLREALPKAFPGTVFSFLPADIVSQILNFGAPAPIDVQISGPDAEANRRYAGRLKAAMARIAGIADVRIQQAAAYPAIGVDIDRSQADRVGLSENDVTRTLTTNLAGSQQTAPAFWLDPANGVSYPLVVQTAQYRINSLDAVANMPVTAGTGATGYQLLGGLGRITRTATPAVVSHYAIRPVLDIYATTQGRDLGAVEGAIDRIVKATAQERPAGMKVAVRGQVQTMNTAFDSLIFGLVAAIVVIYLLLVVNFQSWIDPAIIVSALPSGLAGIVWMLFGTHTPLSVPALTGAIMCMGVATANSVLVVTFARERMAATGDALRAAMDAGATRFRPVLMTALAMVIGMLPMALGLGDGGEQNAPLGRAVIGGLICATIATLFFVPVLFRLIHGRVARRAPGHPMVSSHAIDGEPANV